MIEFKLPELGENIEQGDLVRLMVAPGAAVSAGQSVMELETDKAVVEVPSSVSGTVQEIRVKEGDKIKVGQVIFTVDGAEAKASTAPNQPAAPAVASLRKDRTRDCLDVGLFPTESQAVLNLDASREGSVSSRYVL